MYFLIFFPFLVWFWGDICTPGNPYYWVLPWLYLQHGFLPAAVGIKFGSCRWGNKLPIDFALSPHRKISFVTFGDIDKACLWVFFVTVLVENQKLGCAVDLSDWFVHVAELSEVLWTMVLHLALTFKGGLGVVASFALFAFWAGQCFFCPLHYNLVVSWLIACHSQNNTWSQLQLSDPF